MKLTRPTDFEILDALSEGRRNVAANIAIEIDKERGYVNTRLPVLADYQLVKKVGPTSNSGLYEITRRGLAVLHLNEEYGEVEGVLNELENKS